MTLNLFKKMEVNGETAAVKEAPARMPGPTVPGVPGLELFQDVVPASLAAKVVCEVEVLVAAGADGTLPGKTYATVTDSRCQPGADPRMLLQFGVRACSLPRVTSSCCCLPCTPPRATVLLPSTQRPPFHPYLSKCTYAAVYGLPHKSTYITT